MGIFITIVIGICVLVVLVSVGCGFIPDDNVRIAALTTGAIAFVIGALATIFSTVSIVPTREVGIVTSFGKVKYETDNGLHWTYPWQNLTNMDAAIQLEKFDGADNFGSHGNAVLVTLGNNTKAYANVSIQWRLDPKDLGTLYQNFRSFAAIRDNLVNTNFFQALNTEFGKFDPLACVPEKSTPDNVTPKCTVPDQASFGGMAGNVQADVQQAMEKSNAGGRVTIDRVLITNIVYNDDTQGKLNDLLAEKARTRVAQQREQTAAADAAANNALSASLNNDPNLLTSKCFDLVASGKLNSAVGCWPASVGPGVPVIGTTGR